MQFTQPRSHKGSNYSSSAPPVVDVNYGYTNFDQLNRAVYAASIATPTIPSVITTVNIAPVINVANNVTENESAVITKPIKIVGSGTTCNDYPTVTLKSGLNEPTIWFYGLSTVDGDAINRQPTRGTMTKVAIMANNTQQSGTSTDGPAVLFTGNTAGVNSPLGSSIVLTSMAISSDFSGDANGPHAYSTSQNGTSSLTGDRYASFAVGGSYSAKYTRRPVACTTIVQSTEVMDYYDNSTLAKMILDNIVNVANCEELNDAIQNAVGPEITTILATTSFSCDASVNNTAPINIDAVPGATLTAHWILNGGGTYNSGSIPRWSGFGGGTTAICSSFTATPTYGGTVLSTRVTVFPPACLQAAVDLITPGSTNLIVAADGNDDGPKDFTETSGVVTIAKQFDFRGATSGSAAGSVGSLGAGDATFDGIFSLDPGADFQVLSGTVTSVNGTSFGDVDKQVQLNFSATGLSNYGGNAIDMALRLIGNSGSRRLELTQPSYSAELPTINKRVYINGLPNRGTVVAGGGAYGDWLILNGSGDCNNPSVLRNLSLNKIYMPNSNDCIQTALGIADCSVYTQNLEGVGTNATNGSGGIIDLNAQPFNNQHVDIAKNVVFAWANNIGNNTLTLRRGADVAGLNDWANEVSLEQCSTFVGAQNPSMQQAVTFVKSNGTVTIAGYGNNPLGSGTDPNGVWQFNNITINKDITINGQNTGAKTSNCAADGSSIASNETVIGGHDGSSTYSTSNPIFLIGNNGITISGITFANINATAGTAANRYAIRNNGAYNDVTISNNMLLGTSASMPGLIDAASISGTKQNWIITGNYASATNIGAPAMLVHFDNGTANAATTRIYDNKIDMNNQSNIDGIAVGNIHNSSASLSNIENYPASNYFNIDENHISNINNTSRGIRLEGAVNGINGVLVRRNTIIGDATMAAKTGNGVAIDVRLTSSGSTGSNRINIRNNFINYCNNGVYMYHGTLVNDGVHFFNPSNLTIDSNNIAFNTNGVHIDEIRGYMTNDLDCRFNWWGSVVGPTRNGTLTNLTNSSTSSYSTTSTTYQPFSPTTVGVSNIRATQFRTSAPDPVTFNTSLNTRLIPEAVSSNDRASGTCGWQPEFIMGPVLRVNNAQDAILSMHYSVTDARNGDNNYPNSSTPIISTPGARSNDDKIWVLGKDRFQSLSPLNLRNPNGYPMTAYPEATYPVVFGDIASPELESQPSAVIGRLDPLYPVPVSGTGAIKVASDFPKGFEINTLDVETEAAEPIVTIFEYNHGTSAFSTMTGSQNSIQNNEIYNKANVSDFTGVLVNSNSSGGLIVNGNQMYNTTSNRPIMSRGIVINSVGLNTSGNKSANVTVSANTVNMQATGSSAGIYLNLANANSSTVNSNSITGASVTNSDYPTSSYLGNGIHVVLPQSMEMSYNSITGGNNTTPTRFGNGIVVDRPLTGNRVGRKDVYLPYSTYFANLYAQGANRVSSTFFQETSSDPKFGYGIKVFSSTGTGNNTNGIIIDNNRIGSTSAAPASAGILLAGFDGTANATILRNVIIGVNNTNSGSGSNSAALQIFTSTLAGQPISGTITVDSNVIGNNQLNGGNTLGLAIGTNESGVIRNSNADNLTVNVTNNYFRSHAQTVGIGSIEVADGRPNAGQNIRNMFTNGNNTFSYGAILTGENAPGDYITATSRTAIAQPFGVNEPVKISRLIETPLNATTSDVATNTVEVAPNAYSIVHATGTLAGLAAIEPTSNSDVYSATLSRHYYAEQLSAGNKRILMNGPSSATLPARILAGSAGTGIAFTSTARENKDIRGNIQFHAIGGGWYGQVPIGAANKGDIYLQRSAVGTDNGVVTFWYDATTLGSQSEKTANANSTDKTLDIKAGLDDADDDNFAGSSSSTDSRRRTGVFVAGNGASFEKNTTNEAITGTNVLNVYPNPASGDVTVAFRVPMEGVVRVALYNALGEKVTDLREEYLRVDNYTTSFSGANLPSGTYHVRLVHDLFTRTVPVTIIK